LKLEDFQANSKVSLNFNDEIFDYDNIELSYGIYSGQIYKNGHEPVGIHRISYKDNSIFEG
jgi:hypothetical protein